MKTREIKRMGASRRKGSVVPLGSQFPLEEIHKASKRVQDAISDKNNELHRLQTFLSDNNNLVNLVQKLPEQLSHDVMVPFGKAAFFPGRLIHTNEFLVLLGEGYYADRTSKQTVEILKRRGKTLDSQVDSIQAMIKDLEAEASLFNATASEVEDGIVEIMEEYVENGSEEGESESDSPMEDAPSCGNDTATEVEYASLLSKMDELEKQEELDAKNGDSSEETTVDFDHSPYQRPVDNNSQNPEDINQATPLDRVANNNYFANDLRKEHNHQQDIADQLNFASLAVQSQVREGKNLSQKVKSVDASLRHPISQGTSASKIEAFTGSIVEHAENLQTSSREQSSTSQVSGSQPSKPVSRFKMQRR